MQLAKILSRLKEKNLVISAPDGDIEITGVTYNSKKAESGNLFICKGATFKKEYLLGAVENGIAAYLSEIDYEVSVPCILVSDIRKAMAYACAEFYGNPADKLTIIGVTGTKGKTTVAFMVKSIFDASHVPCGITSTVRTETGKSTVPSTMTTPESPDLQRMFAEMVESGYKYSVMEVSSQGLQYDRVIGTKLAAGAFVNIGIDHISPVEHKDFNEYFSAKKKIFEHTDFAVINIDDEHSDEMISSAKANGCKICTYGLSDKADIYAYNIKKNGIVTEYTVKTPDWTADFTLPMLGDFNVNNSLAAIGLCMNHFTVEQLQEGIKSVKIPGRMNVFNDGEITVIVDYAHNKLSFETLFHNLRKEFPGKRMISVFGCPGSKALVRRKDLGDATGRLCDFTVLTAEDPNYDNVEDINREVAQYIDKYNGKYISIPDRKSAIEYAINNATADDVIVICGKGEEIYQRVNNGYIPYEGDIELAKYFLKNRK